MAEELKARAVGKYIRVAPRKVQQVVELIRGTEVEDALNILRFTTKASSKAVLKVLNSAVANARQSSKQRGENLYVSEVYVDQGPTLKRFRPRAMGRATRIRKRSSHVTIVLAERPAAEVTKETKKARAAKKAKETKAEKATKAKRPQSQAAKRQPKKEKKDGAKG